MIRNTLALAAVLVVALAYSGRTMQTQSRSSNPVVLFEGALLIAGDGSQAVMNSAMLVENGTITRIGAKGAVAVPRSAARVDLTGKTVMPALINTHGHPGFQRGLTYGAENYTRETIMDDLNRALYFGIAAVQSQGIEKGDVMYRIRADQEAGPSAGTARPPCSV